MQSHEKLIVFNETEIEQFKTLVEMELALIKQLEAVVRKRAQMIEIKGLKGIFPCGEEESTG